MLILINPLAEAKDQVLINPAMIVRVHPVYAKASTADPEQVIWTLGIDLADGMSSSVGFSVEENARAVEGIVMEALRPLMVPLMQE